MRLTLPTTKLGGIWAILPEFVAYPQHLHAVVARPHCVLFFLRLLWYTEPSTGWARSWRSADRVETSGG
jgi:hypothetical protein